MSSEYDRRAAVVESLHPGHKAKEIIGWFKYPKTMVYDLVKAYEASDDKKISGQTHKKRSGAIRTPEFFVADIVDIQGEPQQKHKENCQGNGHQ